MPQRAIGFAGFPCTIVRRVYRLRADRRYRIYGWPGFRALSERIYGEWFGWVDFTYR